VTSMKILAGIVAAGLLVPAPPAAAQPGGCDPSDGWLSSGTYPGVRPWPIDPQMAAELQVARDFWAAHGVEVPDHIRVFLADDLLHQVVS
jgi:hypothetical protein